MTPRLERAAGALSPSLACGKACGGIATSLKRLTEGRLAELAPAQTTGKARAVQLSACAERCAPCEARAACESAASCV
eukprot:3165384-Amphidinium_carterae.3